LVEFCTVARARISEPPTAPWPPRPRNRISCMYRSAPAAIRKRPPTSWD
jgi:hypothetical protein